MSRKFSNGFHGWNHTETGSGKTRRKHNNHQKSSKNHLKSSIIHHQWSTVIFALWHKIKLIFHQCRSYLWIMLQLSKENHQKSTDRQVLHSSKITKNHQKSSKIINNPQIYRFSTDLSKIIIHKSVEATCFFHPGPQIYDAGACLPMMCRSCEDPYLNDPCCNSYIDNWYVLYIISIYPSIHLSIHPSIHPSIYLSIYIHMYMNILIRKIHIK